MTDAPTIVLDCNYIGHRTRYAMGGLSHSGNRTGVIYGFLESVLSIGEFFGTNDFLFCWDSRHSYRKRIYPDYKKRPPKTDDERKELELAFDQFVKIRRNVLPHIGFANVFMAPGIEADDLMAEVVNGRLGDFIIVTSDEDLYQCLAVNVRIFHQSKSKMMTLNRFRDDYGIEPSDWPTVKAVGGCSSDNIPGLKGVGEKTILQYLNGEFEPQHPTYVKIDRFIRRDGDFVRFLSLTKLPFPKTPTPEVKRDDFDVDAFLDVCDYYGFESFMQPEHLDRWKRFFDGKFAEPVRTKRKHPMRGH